MAVCKVRPLAEALTDATVYVLYACILRTFFHVYIICIHYDRITAPTPRHGLLKVTVGSGAPSTGFGR